MNSQPQPIGNAIPRSRTSLSTSSSDTNPPIESARAEAKINNLSGVFNNAGWHALVVDDYPMNRLALVSILQRMGIQTDSADNGTTALSMLKNGHFDICLMDVHMPSLSGIEATWSLRLSKGWTTSSQIPVIGITADTGEKEQQACLEAGMNACISKPIRPNHLAETIQALINEHHSQTASGPDTASRKSGESGGEAPFWDLDDLLDRIMGNRELALTLRDGFIFDVPRQMAKLRESFGHNDHENTLMHAHRIKGAAACVGANRLAEAASDLESASREGNQAAARTAFFRLEWIFDQTLQALESSRNDP